MHLAEHLCPYLHFKGEARQALETYARIFEAQAQTMTFTDSGMEVPEAEKDYLMHGQLVLGSDTLLMAADIPSTMPMEAAPTTLSLFGGPEEDEKLRGYWAALLEDGGREDMPLNVAPWGDAFGQLTDRFGTIWYVNIGGQSA